jgi:hypothetical protein
MSEMFDINLISHVQGLDKKFSISEERPSSKRKVTDDNKHKGRHFNDSRTMKHTDNYNNNDDNFSEENKDNHAGIDITI